MADTIRFIEKTQPAFKTADIIVIINSSLKDYKTRSKTSIQKAFIAELKELTNSLAESNNEILNQIQFRSFINILLNAKPAKPKISNKMSTSQRVFNALIENCTKLEIFKENEFIFLKALSDYIKKSEAEGKDVTKYREYLPGFTLFPKIHETFDSQTFKTYAANILLFIGSIDANLVFTNRKRGNTEPTQNSSNSNNTLLARANSSPAIQQQSQLAKQAKEVVNALNKFKLGFTKPVATPSQDDTHTSNIPIQSFK